MKLLFKFLLFSTALLFFTSLQAKEIVINEIFYNAVGSDENEEWVEIVNISTSSVDIKNWKFYDGSNHILKSVRGDLILLSQEYVVLCSSGSKFIDEYPYCSADVVDTVMTLKNTTMTITLYDGDNNMIDTVTYYSAWNNDEDGKSIERKEVFSESNDSSNWFESKELGGTPGSSNSSGLVEEEIPEEEDGHTTSITEPEDYVYPVITEVAPNEFNDFVELYYLGGGYCPGFELFQGESSVKSVGGNEVEKDDYWVVYFNSTQVDEISDANSNGVLEFYTAHNGLTATDNVISIRNTAGTIYDAVIFSNQDRGSFIYSSSYDIAVATGIWEPEVVSGYVADYEKNSVNYVNGGTGKSVARKLLSTGFPSVSSPGNASDWWISNVLTPGEGYSLEQHSNKECLEIIGPNPFSPYDSDPGRRMASISFQVPDLAVKRMYIFDVRGRKRINLIDNDITFQGVMLAGQGSGFISWDGSDSNGDIVPMGIYIVYLEAQDSHSGAVWQGKKTIVVAKQLR
ncbi:MAG: lamin tail domain-containing protein [bacterium]